MAKWGKSVPGSGNSNVLALRLEKIWPVQNRMKASGVDCLVREGKEV